MAAAQLAEYSSSDEEELQQQPEDQDHLSATNILRSRRTVRAPVRYRDESYARLVLEDIPAEEHYWAVEAEVSDPDFSSDSEVDEYSE